MCVCVFDVIVNNKLRLNKVTTMNNDNALSIESSIDTKFIYSTSFILDQVIDS